MKILLIVPAYNEQDNILGTIRDVEENCPEMDILVINDCSKDGTKQLLREHRINYLDLSCNLGIGGAVQAGYRYALQHQYDIAIQFDGDGQHEARYLRDLTDRIISHHADIAIGSRFLRKEGFQSSGARRAGIHFLSRLIQLLCGVKVLDVTSGMRAVNRRFIQEYSRHYAQDYPEPEAILQAGLMGADIQEVPVQMKSRENGESSIRALQSLYYMIKVSMALIVGRISAGRGRRGTRT